MTGPEDSVDLARVRLLVMLDELVSDAFARSFCLGLTHVSEWTAR